MRREDFDFRKNMVHPPNSPKLTQHLLHTTTENAAGDGGASHDGNDDLGCRLLPDVSPASLRSGISSLLSEMDR